MTLLFMMGIGVAETIVLVIPIAALIFMVTKNRLKKRWKTEFNNRILLWSIGLTIVLTPLIFMALIALIFYSFSFYESLDY